MYFKWYNIYTDSYSYIYRLSWNFRLLAQEGVLPCAPEPIRAARITLFIYRGLLS